MQKDLKYWKIETIIEAEPEMGQADVRRAINLHFNRGEGLFMFYSPNKCKITNIDDPFDRSDTKNVKLAPTIGHPSYLNPPKS